jgi:hypothetical protein
VLAITVPVLELLFRKWLPELMGTIVLSALLAHTGWHWMIERGAELLQYNVTVPALGPAFAAVILRWIMLALIVVGAVWILKGVFGMLPGRSEANARAAAAGSEDGGGAVDPVTAEG